MKSEFVKKVGIESEFGIMILNWKLIRETDCELWCIREIDSSWSVRETDKELIVNLRKNSELIVNSQNEKGIQKEFAKERES